MSTTTDNRVVEMRFNNQQFERNAKESIGTLDRLKQALKFDRSSTKGLEDLQRATKDFNLDAVTKSVDNVSDHFSALGVVGMTVINRLTNAAIDFGKKAISSMTGGLDQGFDKYSSKMEAVQVMLINSGAALADINALLDDLQFYTDETSYSFSQMVSAMGKFTAANVDIEVAEEMVQGIANWAATAGVNAVQAERAFDAMTKAIAKGYMEYDRAGTLNEMNMFTPDARKLMLEIAAKMGTIRKEGEKFYANVSTSATKTREMEINADNFLSTLTKGKWATKGVMEEFLHLYNAAADELDEYDLAILEAAGLTEHFGEEAYDAAYVAKTFGDAVGAIRDALSSGWSRSFEAIFGNYKEASDIWTDVANLVSTVIIDMADARNAMLEGWKAIGERLILGIIEAFRNLTLIVSAAKAGFDSVFEGLDSEGLYNITKSFHELMLRLRPSQELLHGIANAFAIFFRIVKSTIPIIKAFASGIGLVLLAVANLAMGFVELVAKQILFLKESGLFESVIITLANILKTFVYTIGLVVASIVKLVDSFARLPVVQRIVSDLSVAFVTAGQIITGIVEAIINALYSFVNEARAVEDSGLPTFFEILNNVLDAVWSGIIRVKDALVSFVNFIIGADEEIDDATESSGKLADTVDKVGTNIKNLGDTVKNSNVKEELEKQTNAFKNFFGELTGGKIAMAAAGVAVVALIKKFTSFKNGSSGFGSVSGFGGSIFDVMFNTSGLLKKIALIGMFGGAAGLLIKHFKKVKSASDAAKEASDNIGKVGASVNELTKVEKKVNPIINFFSTIGDKLKTFAINVSSYFGFASDKIKKFFDELTLGKVIVGSFAAMVISTIAQFAIGLGGIPLLSLSLSKALWEVGSAIRNWSIWGVDTFGDTCMKIGKSLIYFAGAMLILAQVPVERFNEVSKAMGGFLVSLLAITGFSSLLAINGKLDSIWEFGLTLLSLAGTILVLVGAMKLLETVKPETVNIVKELVGFLGIAQVVTTLVSTLGPSSKKFTAIIRNVKISFMGLALAIGILGIAIWRLSTIPVEQLKPAADAMRNGLMAFAGVLLTASMVGSLTKSALKSFVLLLAAATAFAILTETLIRISNSGLGIEHITENFEKYAEIVLALSGLFAAISLLTKWLKPAAKDAALMSVALLSLSVAMGVLTGVLIMLGKVGDYISEPGMLYSFGALITIGAALMLAMSGFKEVGKEAAKASLALIPVTVAMAGLASLGIILALIPDPWVFGKAIGAIVALGGLVAAINFTASKINVGVWKPLTAVIGVIVAIAGSLFLLSKYGDIGKIGYIAEDMALVIAAIGAVMFVLQNAVPATPALYKTIGMLSLVIASIGLSIAMIGTVETDQAFIAAVGISGVLLALAGAMKILGTFNATVVNGAALLSLIGAIVAIGISLHIAAKNNWKQILNAAAGISLVLLALAGAYKVVNSLSISTFNLAPLLALIAAVVAIGWSLAQVSKYNWASIINAAAGITLVLLALGPALGILAPMTMQPLNPGPLIAILGSLVVVAGSLWAVAQYPWQQILAAMLAINVTLGVLTGVMYALAIIGTIGFAGMIGGALAFDVLAASLIILAQAFNILAAVPFESLLPNLIALGVTLAVLLGAGALMAIPAVGQLIMLGFLAIATGLFIISQAAIGFATAATLIANATMTMTAALMMLGLNGPMIGEGIKQMLISIGEGIGTGLASIVTSFALTLVGGITSGLNMVVTTILGFAKPIADAFGGLFSGLASLIDSLTPDWLGPVVKGVGSIISYLRGDAATEMSSAGGDMVDAMNRGIAAEGPQAEAQGRSLGQVFIDGFRAITGWHSPPEFILNFFTDLITAFDAGTASAIPSISSDGASMGDALGSSFESNAQPYLNSLIGKIQRIWSMISGANAEVDALADDASDYVDSVYDEAKQKYETERNAKEILEAARKKNAEGDANDRDDISFDEQKDITRWQTMMRNGRKYITDVGDVGDGGSGGGKGGGGGGGGAAAAAEEAKELFDVWKDGGKVIQKVAENFGSAYEKLGYTHPLELGADAVQNLANKMWELAHTGEDAATLASYTTEEKLSEMKELFDNFYSDVRDTIQGAGDIFGSFTEKGSESISDWKNNLDKQEASIDNWVRHIEQLSARGASYDVVEQFITWGPQEDARLRKMLAAPESAFNAMSDRIVAYNDYNLTTANSRTERVYAALAATLIDKTEETTEEVTENVEQAATEAETTLENATNQYVVVNRQGAVSVINSIGQVVKANGELAQSAFDVAKVTQQALSEVEDAYISTKQAVLDAVNVDIFSKFDTETEIDKEEIIDTAHDTLNAWTMMYDGMGKLAERGLSKDFILNKLIPMGESAYQYVQAMLEMTQDELAGFNSMVEQAMSLPKALAEQLATDISNATLLATQGLVAGLGNEATYQAAKDAASGIVNRMIEEINNPSSGVATVGQAAADGTAESINSNNDVVTNAGVQAMNESVRVWKAGAAQDGWEVGKEFQAGRAQGILDNQYLVDDAFDEEYDDTMDGVRDNYGIASPSKVFARIGKFLDLGLAKGIVDNISVVKDASEISGNSAIDSMMAVVGHISDIINGEVQVDPTIRPVLDLSGVEGGAAAIDSMFGGTSYSLTRGVDEQAYSGSINDLLSQMMANQATPVTAGAPINMYVYAAPGQSEEEIANIVEQKLMFRINRQGGVWR